MIWRLRSAYLSGMNTQKGWDEGRLIVWTRFSIIELWLSLDI